MTNEMMINNKELLSMNELDQVAGGTTTELSNDSRFLNVLLRGRAGQPNRYGELKCHFADLWGVDTRMGPQSLLNKYYINGKKVTRAEAWSHAEAVVGKHLIHSEWDW